jgi:glutamine amidotransferase
VSGPRVAVLDYGSGNLRSVVRAVERAGAEVTLTADPSVAEEATGHVVPGVGAFAACMQGLLGVGGERVVERRLIASRPVLGICVGMQVLFAEGIEHGVRSEGCGEWPGIVERLHAPIVPHMGWNTVEPGEGSRMFAGIEDQRFYFVHS